MILKYNEKVKEQPIMRSKLGLSSNRLALKFGKGKLDSILAMFEFDRNINIFGSNDILEIKTIFLH